MATFKANEIKGKVWKQLVKHEGLPENSRAVLDLEETTEAAIEAAIIMTAQAIFSEIAEKRRAERIQYSLSQDLTTIVRKKELDIIEDKWLHDACNFCETRKPSVIRRPDGKRICVTCEIHGGDNQ